MSLSPRDRSVLELLDRTPATAALILKGSAAFPEAFHDERRVRERLQALIEGKLVRSFPLALIGHGGGRYYQLTTEGYRVLHGHEVALPAKTMFLPLSPSRLLHSMELAEVIVHALVSAHQSRIGVSRFHRENELILEIGGRQVSPDFHLQGSQAGKVFNILFELDRSTEPLDSNAATSIRTKLATYAAYQEHVLGIWRRSGRQGPRLDFRVAFLTQTIERAYHILAFARDCALSPDRHLCLAQARESFLSETKAMGSPIFLDHDGRWTSLVELHPNALPLRMPVRLPSIPKTSLPI